MTSSNSQSKATDSKGSNAPKVNTKAHEQLGLTTQADKDAHDKKVAERIAALNAASSTPTRTDVPSGRTVGASSDVITVDVNECIRFKKDGNYGIVAGQHQQLNELFIEQALANKVNWSFKGDQCLVAISWSAIDDSLTDSEGNPYVLCEDHIWQRLPAKEKLRFSGRGNVGQPTQTPKLVYATYNQSFEGKTDQSKNPKKNGEPNKGSKTIGVYNIVIGDGDLTK
tara:strand:- start:178 stop:855 length:678 start_codon:yes stop_codon:yes gene_type:complete